MNKQTFWVIIDKDGNYYPRFCNKNKEDCIKNFEDFSMKKWNKMEKKGFQCIKVKVVPCILEENIETSSVASSIQI